MERARSGIWFCSPPAEWRRQWTAEQVGNAAAVALQLAHFSRVSYFPADSPVVTLSGDLERHGRESPPVSVFRPFSSALICRTVSICQSIDQILPLHPAADLILSVDLASLVSIPFRLCLRLYPPSTAATGCYTIAGDRADSLIAVARFIRSFERPSRRGLRVIIGPFVPGLAATSPLQCAGHYPLTPSRSPALSAGPDRPPHCHLPLTPTDHLPRGTGRKRGG